MTERLVYTPETDNERFLTLCSAYGSVILGLPASAEQTMRMVEIDEVKPDMMVVNRDAPDYPQAIDLPPRFLADRDITLIHDSLDALHHF